MNQTNKLIIQLLKKFNVKEAIKFQKWITRVVIPSILETGKYDIKQKVKNEEIPDVFNELELMTSKSYFYVLQITNNIYKFGIADDIHTRIDTHRRTFGEDINPILLNNVVNKSIADDIEK